MVRPVIVGCRTDSFSDDQLAAFRQYKPLGLLVFSEPCETGKEAVRHVIRQFRDAVGSDFAPACIDQEGGTVTRLKPGFGHGWRDIPGAEVFAELALRDPDAAKKAVYVNAQLIAAEMRELDLTVDFAPVVDVFTDDTFRGEPDEGLHAAAGDLKRRMYGSDPHIVAALGRAFCEGLIDQGIVPVIKHIPGHGRVKADPHYAVTVVNHDLEELDAQDFVPFRELRDMPAAMTGHIAFRKIDPNNSATLSPAVIGLIRNRIGFKNLLFTDALEMCAILPGGFDAKLGVDQFRMPLPKPGTIGEVTRRALAAGCDIVIHGDNSHDIAHTVEMLESAPQLTDAAYDRIRTLLTPAKAGPLDVYRTERTLAELLARR